MIARVCSEYGTNTAAAQAQNAAMEHVAEGSRVRSNRPVTLAAGGDCVATANIRGAKHAVRLLTFVPGAIMGPQPLVSCLVVL